MPKQIALSRMSRAQLDRLIDQATRQRDSHDSCVTKLAAKVRTQAAAAGVGVGDLVDALNGAGTKAAGAAPKRGKAAKTNGRKRRASRGKGIKIKPKYRHPDDKTLTWSGRGVQARWIRDWLKEKKGRKIEDLAIGK